MPLTSQIALSPQMLPDTGLDSPHHTAVVRLHQTGQLATAISGPDAADRPALEAYIREVFRQAHGASIRHFLPQLMSLRDGKGELLAVCGLRHAEHETLFLENYLDAPVESVLSHKIGLEVARNDIVEVGNLAVADPVHARSLLASISLYLHGSGTHWAVFTGLATLRNSLRKLNMQVHALAEASIARLPSEEQAHWGSYYQDGPQVMAVRRGTAPHES